MDENDTITGEHVDTKADRGSEQSTGSIESLSTSTHRQSLGVTIVARRARERGVWARPMRPATLILPFVGDLSKSDDDDDGCGDGCSDGGDNTNGGDSPSSEVFYSAEESSDSDDNQ